MEAKTKLVKDLITGLDLSKEEALEVIVFITAQSGVSFFDFPAVREGMSSIKDLMQVQNEFLQRLLETIGKEADAENIGTDTGSRTEKRQQGKRNKRPPLKKQRYFRHPKKAWKPLRKPSRSESIRGGKALKKDGEKVRSSERIQRKRQKTRPSPQGQFRKRDGGLCSERGFAERRECVGEN